MTAILSLQTGKVGEQGGKTAGEDEISPGQPLVQKWEISASLKKPKLLSDRFILGLETFNPQPLLFLYTFASKGSKPVFQAKRCWLVLAMHNSAINI